MNMAPAGGRLGVLLPGMGAVASTFIAGVELMKKGIGDPIGSLSQMQTMRLGRRNEKRSPLIRDCVPLARPDDLVFGGWDLYPDSVYAAALKAAVLPPETLRPVSASLDAIRPMAPVWDRSYLRNLAPRHAPKKAKNKWEAACLVQEDIRAFQRKSGAKRCVMIWCGSTERLPAPGSAHRSLRAFERGLKSDAPEISPSMVYAYAAISMGIPYANGAPNVSADIPALVELSREAGAPIAGKDFKTGQTLMKTTVAPMIKARMLGLSGWYSINILGNRDGEVLDDAGSFKTKEKSKMSVLDGILDSKLYPRLYGRYHHKVRIDYYPPRGDAKEGWDNIDITGWLGMPMQIKINFLCRDSILAAPIVLDLALFLDLAKRAGMSGIQEWLSFYFKSPQCRQDLNPEHDLFIQHWKLKNALRLMIGELPLDHAGLDYDDVKTNGRAPARRPASFWPRNPR